MHDVDQWTVENRLSEIPNVRGLDQPSHERWPNLWCDTDSIPLGRTLTIWWGSSRAWIALGIRDNQKRSSWCCVEPTPLHAMLRRQPRGRAPIRSFRLDCCLSNVFAFTYSPTVPGSDYECYWRNPYQTSNRLHYAWGLNNLAEDLWMIGIVDRTCAGGGPPAYLESAGSLGNNFTWLRRKTAARDADIECELILIRCESLV